MTKRKQLLYDARALMEEIRTGLTPIRIKEVMEDLEARPTKVIEKVVEDHLAPAHDWMGLS